MHSTPKVFISYSHDNPDHEARVLDLADRLRSDGVDATIDQYEPAPSEGWPRWMDKQLREADFVLVVCTETYRKRADGTEVGGVGLGVRWEANLIYNRLNGDGTIDSRFLPILLDGASTQNIPDPLKGKTHFAIKQVALSDPGYESLYRYITGQPKTTVPQIGTMLSLPPRIHQPTMEKAEVTPVSPKASLSPHDRYKISNNLIAMSDDELDTFIVTFCGNPTAVPPILAGRQARVNGLFKWAEGVNGPGLKAIEEFKDYFLNP